MNDDADHIKFIKTNGIDHQFKFYNNCDEMEPYHEEIITKKIYTLFKTDGEKIIDTIKYVETDDIVEKIFECFNDLEYDYKNLLDRFSLLTERFNKLAVEKQKYERKNINFFDRLRFLITGGIRKE